MLYNISPNLQPSSNQATPNSSNSNQYQHHQTISNQVITFTYPPTSSEQQFQKSDSNFPNFNKNNQTIKNLTAQFMSNDEEYQQPKKQPITIFTNLSPLSKSKSKSDTNLYYDPSNAEKRRPYKSIPFTSNKYNFTNTRVRSSRKYKYTYSIDQNQKSIVLL